jgi:hypothetical protein
LTRLARPNWSNFGIAWSRRLSPNSRGDCASRKRHGHTQRNGCCPASLRALAAGWRALGQGRRILPPSEERVARGAGEGKPTPPGIIRRRQRLPLGTRIPSEILSLGSRTTCCPAAKPSKTSVMRLLRRAILAGFKCARPSSTTNSAQSSPFRTAHPRASSRHHPHSRSCMHDHSVVVLYRLGACEMRGQKRNSSG